MSLKRNIPKNAETSGIDVYCTLVIGQGAYGIPDVAGSSRPEILVFSSGNTENPLGLYKTVGGRRPSRRRG